MDIPSLIKMIFDPQLNRSAWAQEMIKAGDVFRLKIIEVRDQHHALIDFGKFRAMAEVQFPVKPGAELMVKVTDTEGQLRLQLIDPQSRAESSSKNDSGQLKILSFELFDRIQSDIRQAVTRLLNLPEHQLPPHVRQALSTLDAYFEPIYLNRDMDKWFPLLRSRVEDSGLFFEKKTADIILQLTHRPESELAEQVILSPEIKKILTQDLKPLLLMLKEYMDAPDAISRLVDSKVLSSFKGSLDTLLAEISNQQLRAVQRHELPDPHQVFSFTLPLKENHEKARLKLYCPKKKRNASRNGFKISLLLNMDRIGEVRTDLTLRKKDLSITFFVKNEASKKQFDNHFAELRKSLNPLFDYLILKTVVSEKKIQDFHHEDLGNGHDRQIDLRT